VRGCSRRLSGTIDSINESSEEDTENESDVVHEPPELLDRLTMGGACTVQRDINANVMENLDVEKQFFNSDTTSRVSVQERAHDQNASLYPLTMARSRNEQKKPFVDTALTCAMSRMDITSKATDSEDMDILPQTVIELSD
jgi:hypothetical protein